MRALTRQVPGDQGKCPAPELKMAPDSSSGGVETMAVIWGGEAVCAQDVCTGDTGGSDISLGGM